MSSRPRAEPLGARRDVVGAVFGFTPDAALLVVDSRVVDANDAATRLLGDDPAAALEGGHLPRLLEVPVDVAPVRLAIPPYGHADVVHRTVAGQHVLLLHDATADVRRSAAGRRLADLSRDLLGEAPSMSTLLQRLCAEAKELCEAPYSVLLGLREGSLTETTHFAYDAPRHLFPPRMPRVVGLLAVPVTTGRPARVADIRGHAGAVGLPGVHPPMGPLLAVPLVAGDDQVLGELAVARPPGAAPFSELDEELLVELAAHAAVAVRWAQGGEAERERLLVRQEVVDTARHDIRTPLGAGKGFAQLLRTRRARMTDVQVETALDGLVDAFTRIEAFSERLLLDDSVTAGVSPRWATVDVGALMACVLRDVEGTTGRSGTVVVDIGPDAPATLRADPEMVREVLDNLVGNALKHAGSASITVRTEDDHLRVDVRDAGPGIAEQEQAHLFDRWTRGSVARAGSVPGLGLGLSIVKRLVVAHGGLLGVSSRPGEGATFWVTFPLATSAGEPLSPWPVPAA